MAEEMFRPPINRAMKVLDRSFFQKKILLSAAQVLNNQDIASCRRELQRSKDILALERYSSVHPAPSTAANTSRKCILLRPEVDSEQRRLPFSPKVQELQTSGLIEVVPYELQLNYDYWTYLDIASAILPQGVEDETPSSFTIVGHVAHLNLRDKYLEYKTLIGELLMDKNPGIRTVINKVEDVGEESEFRTFKYEVLVGEHDMDVEVREADCTFRFNYAKVYWNTRLNTEHTRLVDSFKPGVAVCDVMAGIGPFAVPAGKKKVFVWANDLNPDSYDSLRDAIRRNKVSKFVMPFNTDGRAFIRNATTELLRYHHEAKVHGKPLRRSMAKEAGPVVNQTFRQPRTFAHYVMNLPATALEFLPSFVGLYSEEDRKSLPADFQLPMIHVYCFSVKDDDNVTATTQICQEISTQLGYTVTTQTPELNIHDVRDVAPHKRMFCASFRLPEEVAFRKVS